MYGYKNYYESYNKIQNTGENVINVDDLLLRQDIKTIVVDLKKMFPDGKIKKNL
jgi:hypothetical protein